MPKDWSRRDVMGIVAKAAIAAGLVALFVVPSDLDETTKLAVCLILLWLMVGWQLGKVGLEHLPRRRGTFSNEPSPIVPQHHKPVVDLSKIRTETRPNSGPRGRVGIRIPRLGDAVR
jgi:hypothetical protein